MKRLFIASIALCVTWSASAQKEFKLASPNGRVTTEIELGGQLTYSISLNGEKLMDDSPIGMTLTTGEVWGQNPKLKSQKRQKVDQYAQFIKMTSIMNEFNKSGGEEVGK